MNKYILLTVIFLVGILIVLMFKNNYECRVVEGQTAFDRFFGGVSNVGNELLQTDTFLGGSAGMGSYTEQVASATRSAGGTTRESSIENINQEFDRLNQEWQNNHLQEYMIAEVNDSICGAAASTANFVGGNFDADNKEGKDICLDVLNTVEDCSIAVVEIANEEISLGIDAASAAIDSADYISGIATNRDIIQSSDLSSPQEALASLDTSNKNLNVISSCDINSISDAVNSVNLDDLNDSFCVGTYQDEGSIQRSCNDKWKFHNFFNSTEMADDWCRTKDGCSLNNQTSPCTGDDNHNASCIKGFQNKLYNTVGDINRKYESANSWCTSMTMCNLNQVQSDANKQEKLEELDTSNMQISESNPIFMEHVLTFHDIAFEIKKYLNCEFHPDISIDDGEIIRRLTNNNGNNESILLIDHTQLGLINLDLAGSHENIPECSNLANPTSDGDSAKVSSDSNPRSGTANNSISESINILLNQYKYLKLKYQNNVSDITNKIDNSPFNDRNIDPYKLNELFINIKIDGELYNELFEYWLDTIPRDMDPQMNNRYEHAKRLLGLTDQDASDIESKIQQYMDAVGGTSGIASIASAGDTLLECGKSLKTMLGNTETVAEETPVRKVIGVVGDLETCGEDIYNTVQDLQESGALTGTNFNNLIKYDHLIRNICRVLNIPHNVIHNAVREAVLVGAPHHTGDREAPGTSTGFSPGKMAPGETPPFGSILLNSNFEITADNIDDMNYHHDHNRRVAITNSYEVGDKISLFYIPERNPHRYWLLLSIISYLKQFVTIFDRLGFLPQDNNIINQELTQLIESSELSSTGQASTGQASTGQASTDSSPPPPHPCMQNLDQNLLNNSDSDSFASELIQKCISKHDSIIIPNCREQQGEYYKNLCNDMKNNALREQASVIPKINKYYNHFTGGSGFESNENTDIGDCSIVDNAAMMLPFYAEYITSREEPDGLSRRQLQTSYHDIFSDPELKNKCMPNNADTNIVDCHTSCSNLSNRIPDDFLNFMTDDSNRRGRSIKRNATRIYSTLDSNSNVFSPLPSCRPPPSKDDLVDSEGKYRCPRGVNAAKCITRHRKDYCDRTHCNWRCGAQVRRSREVTAKCSCTPK